MEIDQWNFRGFAIYNIKPKHGTFHVQFEMFCIVISGKTNTFMQIWTHYKSITSGATPSFSVIIIS